jgi:hypothetical protein
MSQAMEHVKGWLLKNGASPYVEQTAKEMVGRSGAEIGITATRVTVSMALERRGMKRVTANGLARAFVVLVRERLAKGAEQAPVGVGGLQSSSTENRYSCMRPGESEG